MWCVRLLAISLVVLLSLTLTPVQVRAWEYAMEGAFTNTYEYYLGQGKNGFFGTFDVDRSVAAGGLAAGDYATLNGWVGRQVRDLVSGSDATRNYPLLELYPDIKVNQAVRFRAKYRLGDYGDPWASEYLTNTRPGRDVATSDGQWTMWWGTFNTPWGMIVAGKRPESFGLGIQNDGETNTTTEGLAFVAPYGPFRISWAVRPYWQMGNGSPYYNPLDKNGIRQLAARFFITYRTGPLDVGFFAAWMKWHAGPESRANPASGSAFRTIDVPLRQGMVYAKYNNGRFFFNAELAYIDLTTTRRGLGPSYQESWRFNTELGACVGPAKMTVLYTFMPGPDRRAGQLINKQPFIQNPGFGAYIVFRPYSYLLGYAYGGGVNAFDLNDRGYINAAWVLAGRLDYALAANLNLSATFLWAERSSDGYGWGYVRPAQQATVQRTLNAAGVPVDQITWKPYVNYVNLANAPSIPDRNLGWEAGLGIDWLLLERFKVSAQVNYWEVGRWFAYACADRSVPGWNVPTAANKWGVNPDRSIDQVVGGEIKMSMEF